MIGIKQIGLEIAVVVVFLTTLFIKNDDTKYLLELPLLLRFVLVIAFASLSSHLSLRVNKETGFLFWWIVFEVCSCSSAYILLELCSGYVQGTSPEIYNDLTKFVECMSFMISACATNVFFIWFALKYSRYYGWLIIISRSFTLIVSVTAAATVAFLKRHPEALQAK